VILWCSDSAKEHCRRTTRRAAPEHGVRRKKNRTVAGIMEFELDGSLKEWAKDKPLSILQLDPADRAVLRIAGEYFKGILLIFRFLLSSHSR